MNVSSRYWQICRLSLVNNQGYEYKAIASAREFWQKQITEQSVSQWEEIPTTLFALFQQNSAVAGLCLRCYVSYPILKACQKLGALFAGNQNFTYRDLLPFALNDDGKKQIILAEDGKTQLTLDSQEERVTTNYQLFTVEVLASYNFNSSSSMSLNNWAFLQTKQNKELKKFLAEFGFQHLSDWAMLNRVGVKQMSQLSPQDRHLVEVFHAVYRRDRRLAKSKVRGKCLDPTDKQLTEMQAQLRSRNCVYSTIEEIFQALKRVVRQLREYDIWSYREPLEVYEPDTGNYTSRNDLPTNNSHEETAMEERELLTFLRETLDRALVTAIAEAGSNRVAKLNQSKKYRPFAAKFIPGLQLYYEREMSLAEIAPILDFGNWDRARRILNPGDFLNRVRTLTIQQLLKSILQKAQELGLNPISNDSNYLKNISEHIEAFADAEIFQAAAAEIKAGKNRDLKSVYAEKIRCYCQRSISIQT